MFVLAVMSIDLAVMRKMSSACNMLLLVPDAAAVLWCLFLELVPGA
jgi:hypothetical protein